MGIAIKRVGALAVAACIAAAGWVGDAGAIGAKAARSGPRVCAPGAPGKRGRRIRTCADLLPYRPHAHTIELHLAGANAVTQTIPVSGGTMRATAPDGTTFTLTVPADALVGDEDITMTPTSSIGQIPLTHADAVTFQPNGLMFLKPAKLVIKLGHHVTVPHQRAFAAGGDGSGFSMYPIGRDPHTITLLIGHFSTYGVGSGTPDAGFGLFTDRTSWAQANVAKALSEARAGEILGNPTGVDLMGRADSAVYVGNYVYAHDVVLRDLTLATQNPSLFVVAQAEYLGLLRQLQILEQQFPADSPMGRLLAKLSRLYEQALKKYARSALADCFAGDVTATSKVLDVVRADQLYYQRDLISNDELTRCIRFTVDFDDTIDYVNTVSGATDILHVQAIGVPVTFGGGLTGSGPLNYVSAVGEPFLFGPLSCTQAFDSLTPAANFVVDALQLDLNFLVPTVDKRGIPRYPKIALRFYPGFATETLTQTCTVPTIPPQVTTSTQSRFNNAFFYDNAGIRVSGATAQDPYPKQLYEIALHYVGGPVYAQVSLPPFLTQAPPPYVFTAIQNGTITVHFAPLASPS